MVAIKAFKDKTRRLVHHADILKITAKVNDFFKLESLGVECTPKCGGCKCGTCHTGGKEMTIKEEQECRIIEENMQHDSKQNEWIAGYPWTKDPRELPDNRAFALS